MSTTWFISTSQYKTAQHSFHIQEVFKRFSTYNFYITSNKLLPVISGGFVQLWDGLKCVGHLLNDEVWTLVETNEQCGQNMPCRLINSDSFKEQI